MKKVQKNSKSNSGKAAKNEEKNFYYGHLKEI